MAVPQVVADLDAAPLVWLDGHYSREGTAHGDEAEPALTVLRKLGAVARPGTTIAVDDLALFGASPDIPRLDELLAAAREAFPAATIRTGLDSLVIEA